MTTKDICYQLRFFRRKPGSRGTSMKCFEVVYQGWMRTLTEIRRLLAVRWVNPAYRATGYVIEKVALTAAGEKVKKKRLATMKADGDIPS
jgi:hypothetical protein